MIAMMHIAMADVMATLSHDYRPYGPKIDSHGSTDPYAAVAMAAYGVLVRLVPAQKAQLDIALANSLAGIRDGKRKERGIELGHAAAAQIVQLRSTDNSDRPQMTYTPPVGLGYWQRHSRPGPSPFLSWTFVTPFVLTSAHQFRPVSPPDIFGDLFSRDLAELKEIGGTTSIVRTVEQTNMAKWATESSVAQYNKFARVVAAAKPKDLATTARAFALSSIAYADALLSGLDAKFAYNLWRPWTAIHNAGELGHPEMEDTAWQSLIAAPPHPEYTANHAIQSGAVVTALRSVYGETFSSSITVTSTVTPDFSPTYSSLSQFQQLWGLARIYGGIHYRHSVELGWAQGESVGQWVIKNAYRRFP